MNQSWELHDGKRVYKRKRTKQMFLLYLVLVIVFGIMFNWVYGHDVQDAVNGTTNYWVFRFDEYREKHGRPLPSRSYPMIPHFLKEA